MGRLPSGKFRLGLRQLALQPRQTGLQRRTLLAAQHFHAAERALQRMELRFLCLGQLEDLFGNLPVDLCPGQLFEDVAALLLVGITSADITVTVSTLSDFVDKLVEADRLMNQAIDEKYRELESSVSGTIKSVKAIPASVRDKIIDQEVLKSNLTLTGVQAQVLGKIKSIRGAYRSDYLQESTGRIREFIRRLPRRKK